MAAARHPLHCTASEVLAYILSKIEALIRDNLPRVSAMTDRTNRTARLCGYSGRPGGPTDQGVCPAAAQSGGEVAGWLRDHGSPGKAVVVLFRQQGLCQFRFDEIKAWRGRRVHLVEHGPFDSRGFAIGSPKSTYLRILKPTATILEPALKGATLLQCRLVNERDLSTREDALAQRMRREFAPDP